MKHASIFDASLRRLRIIYIWLALIVTLSFTIPPLVASEQARQRLETNGHRTQNVIFELPWGIDPTVIDGLENFLQKRDTAFSQHLTTIFLEINALMMLLAVAISYYLARRTLEPLHHVLETQERFAAELAHELKTPLATVLLELEAFTRASRNLSATQKKELHQVALSIKEVGQITEQTLALMSVDQGSRSAPEACDLETIAQEALNQIRPVAQTKGITVTGPRPLDTPLTVTGHRIPLKQILMILLDNAVKFTPRGGKVGLTLRSSDHAVLVNVTDTGPGISNEEQALIFDRWHQGDARTSGAGLGLAIAKRIAQDHGGRLVVSSQVGHGAKFTLRLPRA